MEDMASKISELLSDPKGMEKIKSMAEALFSDESTLPSVNSDESPKEDGFGAFSLPDGLDITKLMAIFSALNSGEKDRRTDLLTALKPYLSKERGQKVDKAVKLLKIVSLLPVLKEQGLLELL